MRILVKNGRRTLAAPSSTLRPILPAFESAARAIRRAVTLPSLKPRKPAPSTRKTTPYPGFPSVSH